MSYPEHAGLQVAVHQEGLQVANHEAPEVKVLDSYSNGGLAPKPKRNFTTQRWRLIWIAVLVLVIVIVGAVIGGIEGSKSRRTRTASSLPTSTGPSYPSTTSPSPTASRRSIAALSFVSSSVNNTRVYFQDNTGQLVEAAKSLENTAWSINGTGIGAKNGSAIAAAVSQPSFPLAISIFYFDVDNHIHDLTYNQSTGTWRPGTLSDYKYNVMPNSSLAALYNQCNLCANTTVIAFQDENGHVQIGNLTTRGWIFTDLSRALDPVMGTGLALQPFYLSNSAFQINLYHQKSDLRLSLACYIPASKTNSVARWSLSEQIYQAIPSGSVIAAASSYSNVSTGLESWIELLSAFKGGIQVNTWSGAINDWMKQSMQPAVMSNSQYYEKVYGSVAVTATGSAFGVVKQPGHVDEIENWQVRDDLQSWTLTGNVDTGSSWT
ncbi:MAG: hypothetical protein M1836_004553 [Candelina mexicana]|nr:MAG: hypothetical protein M1836_004553 [Candelina mexicana]